MHNSLSSPRDQPFVAQAYAKNLTAYAAALVQAGGGYVQRNPDVILTIFPYTFWSNGVASPHFTETNATERIEDVLALFRKYRREVWWHIGPTSSPTDLAKRLKSRGLWNFHNRPFLICDLDALITGYPVPPGISITSVEDYAIFNSVPHPIHGLVTTDRKRHIFSCYHQLDLQSPRKHWMFIAEKQDIPIGMAIIYFDGKVAGIYDVEVQNTYRRQCIGTALLQHVCVFARKAGAKFAVLAASEQGAKFYPRFGFSVIGRYPTYYYSIKKQKLDAERLNEVW